MDVLTLTQRVKNSIALGESHFREFKTAYEGKPDQKKPRHTTHICREIGEALVAFANADGGELLIGVEDDGSVTGLPHSDEDIQTMLNAYTSHVFNNHILPLKTNTLLDIDGNKVLYFSVTKGTTQIYQLPDGRCVRRQDKSTMPISVNNYIYERKEKLSREYDRQFVEGATTTDLDIQQIQVLANNFIYGMSPEQYLQQLGLAEYGLGGLRLRMAALLLFAKDISKWSPRSQVRILKISGNRIETGDKYNVLSDEYVTGNIFYLLTKAWENLRPYLSKKVNFANEAKFEQIYVYPENACKEALVNAIAHRDYSIQNCTNIYIYDERLEIESPGELLSTLSIDDLKKLDGAHESRNTYIATALRENSYMQELGEGIRRIFELMERNELTPPLIISSNGKFLISFSHKSIYNQAQTSWLNMYSDFDLDADQKRVVIAGMNGRELSQSDICKALGTSDRNLYDKCVTALRIKGILFKIRSYYQVASMSRERNLDKTEVKRFKIVIPSEINKASSFNHGMSKVYLYNIPKDCNKETISSSMSIFGDLVDITIPLDRHDGSARGFAFVTFANRDSALRAIAIKNITIKGNVASIYPYRPTRRS